MPSSSSPTLERRLGTGDAAAIIVSNVIGGGILFTPPQVAASTGSPWWFLGMWVVGGLLALAGAMAYAELAARRPRAGGEYVYLQAAYGNMAAFLTGWTSFVAGFSGAIAASAVVLAAYVGRFAPAAADSTPIATLPLPFVTLVFSPQSICALSVIALMAFVHLRGVGPGRIVSNLLAALKVSALLLFIAVGFSFGSGDVSNLWSGPPPATSGWLLALVPVMFTYSGWNAAAYVAEEIRDPQRNLPRALAIGTLAVIAIYLLLNALYLFVLPVGELAAVRGSVLDVIADRLLGAAAGDIMGLVSIISIAASISAMTFAGPRVYYAMARDGLFVPAAGKIHPRYKTPATAILAQAVWSGLLVLTGGAGALTRYTGFAVVLFAGVSVAAVFVLRWREAGAQLPFRAWGYPWAPAIFVLSSLIIVVNSIGADPRPSLAGIAIISAGIPLYYFFRKTLVPAASSVTPSEPTTQA